MQTDAIFSHGTVLPVASFHDFFLLLFRYFCSALLSSCKFLAPFWMASKYTRTISGRGIRFLVAPIPEAPRSASKAFFFLATAAATKSICWSVLHVTHTEMCACREQCSLLTRLQMRLCSEQCSEIIYTIRVFPLELATRVLSRTGPPFTDRSLYKDITTV